LRPEKLQCRLDALVEDQLQAGNRTLLLFGDCHPHMVDYDTKPAACRVAGSNCFEILLGADLFRRLRDQRAFFVLPDWAARWQEVVRLGLGSNRESVKCLMTDLHSKLVYVDTGEAPLPEEDLQAFSQYVGLPWETIQIAPDRLAVGIRDALEELERDDHR
ncbi:hypothetical protein LCGC14_2580530, partial [marine sediment metagenome]